MGQRRVSLALSVALWLVWAMLQLSLPGAYTRALFFVGIAVCFLPSTNGGAALLLGIALALCFGNPYLAQSQRYSSRLLQASVIGLGAGMNLAVIGAVGVAGIGYTAIGIVLGIGFGLVLGKLFNTNTNASMLLSVGTAICGGSAIAAVAPVIRAKSEEISVALATVFFLNAAALFLFPPIGHFMNLSAHQFGLWSALAIHDTSSVVGAALEYGGGSVDVATTVKLARALWIVPVSLLIGIWWTKTNAPHKVQAKKPWFILGFLVAAAVVTWVPALQDAGVMVSMVAKKLLVVTLFLIGSNLTLSTIRNVGMKPLLQGFTLWVLSASITLAAIYNDWIH